MDTPALTDDHPAARRRRLLARTPGRRAFDMVVTAAALAVIPLVVLLITVLIDTRFATSPLELFQADKLGASSALILIGTAEGVAIAIVIVVVVVGVQLSADRYSPRIIEIFVRDRLNTAVIGLFLGSMLFTVWVSLELKEDRIPQAGVLTAALLGFIDFALLLPYLRHLFGIHARRGGDRDHPSPSYLPGASRCRERRSGPAARICAGDRPDHGHRARVDRGR
jgi:uncharacterized membrane protein